MSSRHEERRVLRLENDVVSIYDLLSDVQTTVTGHTGQLERIDARLVEHDARFDAVEGRLEGVEGRLAGVEGRLDTVITLLRGGSEPPA